MQKFENTYFIERVPGQYEKVKFLIEYLGESTENGIVVHSYKATMPTLFVGDVVAKHENALICFMSLVAKGRSEFRNFHKGGGRMYSPTPEDKPWLDYGPMAAKDFLHQG